MFGEVFRFYSSICGNLPDNTYIHLGKEYTLKQHGFTRELPWKVTDKVTNDLASLTLVLDSNSQTRTVYPFDFNVCFTYQLKGNSLEIKQRYENRSASEMPFSAGFHPYFLVDDKSQLDIDIPADQYQEKGSQEFHPFNGVFDFNQDEIDVAFRDLTSKSASVTDHSRQLQLIVTWDDTYSTLVFWTVKGKDFYCLEPWTGPRNEYRRKPAHPGTGGPDGNFCTDRGKIFVNTPSHLEKSVLS